MSIANVAGVDVDTRHWIGGRRVASAAVFTDLSPIDEQPLAEVARGGEAEVAAAVRAAGDAFGGWSVTPPKDRAAGVVEVLGRGFEVDRHWLHRLVRVEVDLDQDKLCFYRLRRREPTDQPLLTELSHRIKGGRFYV